MWGVIIKCDHEIEHKKLDMVVVNKEGKPYLVIGITCSGDYRVSEREGEKQIRYDDL